MNEEDRRLADQVPEVDAQRPNAARMYDYHLGGSANFAIDRDAIHEVLQHLPEGSHYARANRAFLRRVVRFLNTEQGIDQFLDLGSGIPTVGNVHEIAHRDDPNARVAYVDVEPVAVHHAKHLLGDSETRVTVTRADIRQPRTVLNADGVAGLLDFDRPIGLLAIGVLPFIPEDEEAREVLAAYRAALAPGSYCAISHISRTSWTEEQMNTLMEIMASTPTPERERTPKQIEALLDGYELLEPGAVPTPQWRPDREPDEDDVRWSNCYCAVGYRR